MPMLRVGDLEVNYREWGQGEPVVLIHGNWTTSLWWQPTLELLPPGFRAIAYDLRGRGHTRGPDHLQAIPTLAEDLHGLLDGLGLIRVHLIGHSLGSAVAMQLALDHPERVHTLTLMAPAWVDGMPAAYNLPAHQLAAQDNRAVYAMALRSIARPLRTMRCGNSLSKRDTSSAGRPPSPRSRPSWTGPLASA